MAQNPNNGGPVLVAALILGASIVAGALLIRHAVDGAAQEVAGLREALGGGRLAANLPSPEAAQPGRPDPNRRYQVNTSGSPSKGNAGARLAIIEFSDFQCPFCQRVGPTLEQIEKEYGDQVRIVFKHLPLEMHPKAPAAHAAAEAAHQQGKFWQMHDLIFANQAAMSPERYVEYAKQLGLDVDRFQKDVASAQVKSRIDADSQEAARLGVSGTPAFFVNGRFLSGAQPFPAFKALIDQELGKG
jgi:protein-disulfide isomerase